MLTLILYIYNNHWWCLNDLFLSSLSLMGMFLICILSYTLTYCGICSYSNHLYNNLLYNNRILLHYFLIFYMFICALNVIVYQKIKCFEIVIVHIWIWWADKIDTSFKGRVQVKFWKFFFCSNPSRAPRGAILFINHTLLRLPNSS